MSERITDERLAELIAHAKGDVAALVNVLGSAAYQTANYENYSNRLSALRELAELREQVRKDAAEIGGLCAAVTQLGGTFGGDETGSDKTLKVGDRVVFRHPNCRFTSSDRGTVVNAQPLTVKWDGDIQSRPNPEYVFREVGA
jgi:hypothetical protein